MCAVWFLRVLRAIEAKQRGVDVRIIMLHHNFLDDLMSGVRRDTR